MTTEYENIEHIRKAVLEIAYGNGLINRYNRESTVLNRVYVSLRECFDDSVLLRVNSHLSALSEEDFNELCAGEQQEPKDDAQKEVEEVLNFIYDNCP